MRAARIVTAVASALVLLVTGYGWTAYRELGARLVTSDVLTRDRPSDGVTDILLVGLTAAPTPPGTRRPGAARRAHRRTRPGHAEHDTLILVRIPDDATLPTTAVSIPRDSYVSVPGFGTHKINSAYVRGSDAARARLVAQGVAGAALEQQSAQAGRRTLITTVEQLTGVSVDHYAEVNLAGFAEITQAVGGVPVCLNAPVRDSYSGANFRAGLQTLEGPAALAFVRQRHGLPRGDLDRVVRQRAFRTFRLEHRARDASINERRAPPRAALDEGRHGQRRASGVRGPDARAGNRRDHLPHDPDRPAEPAHPGGRSGSADRPVGGARLRRHTVRGHARRNTARRSRSNGGPTLDVADGRTLAAGEGGATGPGCGRGGRAAALRSTAATPMVSWEGSS